MHPIISIIVPCYNQSKYLSETLDSILCQTLSEWETIIVDDGSTDDSEIISKRYCSLDTRFFYLYQGNSKVSVARNNGLAIAKGKYVLFLDGDDKIAPTYLSNAISFLENNPEVTVFYSKSQFFGSRNDRWDISYSNYKDELISNSIHVSAVIKKADCLAIGGFDENMLIGLEDWDFYIRLLYPDKIVYQSQEILFFYRQVTTNKSRNKEALEKMNQIEQYLFSKHIEKYYEFWGNPLSIYRDWLIRKAWMNRRLPKLLFNFLEYIQKTKDRLFSILK